MVEVMDFAELTDFTKLMDFTKFTEKLELTEKDRTHGKVKVKTHRLPAPWPTPIYKLSMTSNIFHRPAWAGCLAVLPPSSCTSAH